MNTLPFHIIPPTIKPVPLLISVPHSSVYIPEHLKEQFRPEALEDLDDTDFYVDQLYDFAPSLGITMIVADVNRWVIDLNRDPTDKQLYDDGRLITSLVPSTDFKGQALYREAPGYPTQNEIERRINSYFKPYHNQIATTLNDFKSQFGKALLWDAHSIRRFVPTIHPIQFPDFIIGTNEGRTIDQGLFNIVKKQLEASKRSASINHPFKGGHITRFFGAPTDNIHAIQLEMSKDCYMDDDEVHYNLERAEIIRTILIKTFTQLISKLEVL